MIKTSFEKIDTWIRAQGFSRKMFCLMSEGVWNFDDADWNYKDIPHVNYVHELIDSIPVTIDNAYLNLIIFQKIFFLKLPAALQNFDYSENEQMYYLNFGFFLLIVKSKITSLGDNRTRVETQYNVYAQRLINFLFFPLVKKIIERNYRNLMLGDLPMRERRGWLRGRGYEFNRKYPNKKYSFSETLELTDSVKLPNNLIPSHYTLKMDDSGNASEWLLGDPDYLGLRIVKVNTKVNFYRRICMHQGADLSAVPILRDAVILCPWHNKPCSALATLDLDEEVQIHTKEIKVHFSRSSGTLKLEVLV